MAWIFALVLALFLVGGPAFADPGNGNGKGHEKKSDSSDHDGDADSDSNTAYTEDNDTNDGGTPNNVSDEGDNQHPSGKDRSVEHGKSGNQGNSESDPDDDGHGPDRSNGGPDKPNGSGGEDLADQDGNNGCGNDDDFEDDNEGWCGHKPEKPEEQPETEVKPSHEEKPCDSDSTMPGTQPCGEVAGEQEERPDSPCESDITMPTTDVQCGEQETPGEAVFPGLSTSGSPDTVLGNVIHRGKPSNGAAVLGEQLAAPEESGATLPFTGGNAVPFLAIAVALIVIGVLALRVRRTE